MFPIGKIFESFVGEAPTASYAADGAVTPEPGYISLSGEAATCQTILAIPSTTNLMDKKLMFFYASNVDNATDVDYTTSAGAQTWTAGAVGDMLVLIGAGVVWFKIA